MFATAITSYSSGVNKNISKAITVKLPDPIQVCYFNGSQAPNLTTYYSVNVPYYHLVKNVTFIHGLADFNGYEDIYLNDIFFDRLYANYPALSHDWSFNSPNVTLKEVHVDHNNYTYTGMKCILFSYK